MNTIPRPANRDILGIALPAVGALASEPLMGLLDTALVGRLGPVPLASLGAATAILNTLFAVLIFLEYGTTARLARRVGEGDHATLAREAIQMVWVASALGLLLAAIVFLFPRALLRLVDAPPEVEATAAVYLRIRAAGALPALWVRVGHGIFRGLQDTRTPLGIVVIMHGVNAVLDVLLIFGWGAIGLPAFGVAGAAWATVIATWLGAALFLGRLAPRLRPEMSGAGLRPDPAILRDMLGVSRDIVLRTASIMAPLFMGSRMAAGLGTTALAAHHVGWQLWMALALLLDGFAIAGQALVGRAVGAGQPAVARWIGNRLCLWGLCLGVGFAALFLALRDVLPRVFTDDPAVLAMVGSIFAILALMQIPNAVLFAIDGLLIGASDFAFLRNAMMGLGVLGIITTGAGREIGGSLEGVWLGLSVYMGLRLLVMGWRWWRGGWISDR